MELYSNAGLNRKVVGVKARRVDVKSVLDN